MTCNCNRNLNRNNKKEINADFEERVYDVLDNYTNNANKYNSNKHNNFIWYFDELDHMMTDMTDKYYNNNEILEVIRRYNNHFTDLMYKNVEKMQQGSMTVKKWIGEIEDLQYLTNQWLETISNDSNSEKYNIFFD